MLELVLPLLIMSHVNAELRIDAENQGQIEVGLYFDADHGPTLISSLEIIFEYNPNVLELVSVTNDPNALLMDFFEPLPGFLPCNFDTTDGVVIFIGLAELGGDFIILPEELGGTRIAGFVLDVIGEGPIDVSIPATSDGCTTVIWDGVIPNFVVTGTLTGATINGLNIADIDEDGVVGIMDFLILLAEWGN